MRTDHLRTYVAEATRLTASGTTNEPTYYPALKALFDGVLRELGIKLLVRTNTSEAREEGGADCPDLAFYSGDGDFAVVLCEAKPPTHDLRELAFSAERNDQIGRYLAQTRAVLITNVREFGLLTVDPKCAGSGPVPPGSRRLETTVTLWASVAEMKSGTLIPDGCEEALSELIETAVTRFAPIGDPELLARVLARFARRAKEALPTRFTDAVQGLLGDFAQALGLSFQGKEGEEFLRSSLVQTAFYGLFAGWTLWYRSGAKGEFRWQDCAEHIRIPFLGSLFHEFSHPTRMRELGLREHLDQATEALGRVDRDRFFARFSPRLQLGEDDHATPETRAILYFYEPFLESFDPELRKRLGVWYTPEEVVRYQVRKVDRLLRDELGCDSGFADERVVVLDPCCGTGAYLVEVLRCMSEELDNAAAGALKPARLLNALCTRVIGFEILTAPFVIAHLQIHLMLQAMGVTPTESQRPAVFLTNALTGWEGPEQLKLMFPELQDEHDRAREAKTEQKIIVVLGNPPYDRWAGVPVDEEAALADHYKGIRRDARGRQKGKSALYARFGVRKHLLDDLYIRFFRLAEQRIGERAPYGIVSFISNASFLAGRSHPLMRESLLHAFSEVWVDRLNGDKYATGKVIPNGLPGEGTSDQSVFTAEHDPRGIQVGTSVATLLKRPDADTAPAIVHVRDFWGRADAKRRALLESLAMEGRSEGWRAEAGGKPEGPRPYTDYAPTEARKWLFAPAALLGGYDMWPGLDELFPNGFMGVHTGKDAAVLAFTPQELARRFAAYFDAAVDDADIARMCAALMQKANEFDDPSMFRASMRLDPDARSAESHIRHYSYRPLDSRWIWYDTRRRQFPAGPDGAWSGCLVQRYGEDYVRCAGECTLYLSAVSQSRRRSESKPLLTPGLSDLHLSDRGVTVLPQVWVPPMNGGALFGPVPGTPVANLSVPVWEALRVRLGIEGDIGAGPARALVRDLFHIAMAACHAPQYQEDHASALGQDWARVPVPASRRLFAEGVSLGSKLAALLDPTGDPSRILLEILGDQRKLLGALRHRTRPALAPDDLLVTHGYHGAGLGRYVRREPEGGEMLDGTWGEVTGELYLNEDVFVSHVPEAVWRYELGGYPVIKKWLGYRHTKRRAGRPLSLDEAAHLTSMVQRIAAVLALTDALNAFYERAAADSHTVDTLGLA